MNIKNADERELALFNSLNDMIIMVLQIEDYKGFVCPCCEATAKYHKDWEGWYTKHKKNCAITKAQKLFEVVKRAHTKDSALNGYDALAGKKL